MGTATAVIRDAWHRFSTTVAALIRRLTGKPPSHPHAFGAWGERQAARHLKKTCRYRLRDRNLPVHGGDVDLVMEGPDGAIVFVEVKTRRVHAGTTARGEDAINKTKKRRLVRAARSLAIQRSWTDRPLRIDVVVVEFDPDNDAIEIRHSPDAVRAERRR